jgi:type 1 fimbria pilin
MIANASRHAQSRARRRALSFDGAMRWLVAGLCAFACGAHAALVDATAVDCSFANVTATPWREVTPLTSGTPVNAVLYQRQVSLFDDFRYVAGGEASHELVNAGHWLLGVGMQDGTVQTNVDGIGFKWLSIDNGERVLRQLSDPIAFSKRDVKWPGSGNNGDAYATFYAQQLILTKPAAQLPQGERIVRDLPDNPTVALYAIDFLKGVATIGGEVTVPGITNPSNVCKKKITYSGVGNLTIGGGGPIPVPNKCEVDSNSVVPVDLGKFSISRFGSIHSTSPPVNFSISLSRCAAAAKPTISFRDKAIQPNPDPTLLQLSAPDSRQVARGFNIVMTNGLTGERIAYGEPSAARQYPMQRTGDMALMPLRAQYIRTGSDAELKPGYAGGAAEFTFSFP